MVFPSALKPGSASPFCSLPGGVQLGPPSLTCVRAVPSGRILSIRDLKQPLVYCATVKRIQSSLDHAKSFHLLSSRPSLGAPTKRGFDPSASMIQSESPLYEPNAMCAPSGDQTG